MSGTNESLNQRKAQALPRGSAVMCEWYVDRAENATIWSTDGREFIDFAGGIAVLNTGHRHPKITQAVTEQLQKFTHTAFQIVPYESYITLAERINQRVPVQGPAKTAFFSTGAEALENAVKIARSATGRHGVITFTGSFHGRTMMTMAMTGKVAPYKQDFGPMVPSVFHARFPDGKKVSTEQALESLHDIFSCDIAPHNVAALVIEPIQGEGGFRVVPQAFMQALRDIADQHGILLIADEVQSGFARTGKLFAMEHFTAKADIITMAKSLAGGYPLSAVSGRAEIMDAPNPGGLGGTYAGNPLAIAAANTVLEIIEEEDLCAKANNLGNELVETLTQLSQQCSAIEEVRGLGSMIAVELKDAHTAKAIQDTAMSQGLLLLTCGQKGNVIRFLYPLTIPTDQFRKGVKILSGALMQHAT
ncbi:4-aminobutyrate--2-oxoglutarate transaminase [Rosenbergiella epipactidis]|uniref:4-aminobutyrate--2-oxoglutarate transaminase n=1 Tax=Rosenbergiella epipactidis TaxID=1544694 RepID=UPI001F4E41D3|nr:4-aminobutyrate--2-oxoglutarate transaminase [Rosenbergiella epipactidis]